MAERGQAISDATIFIAALHDTATDVISLLDLEQCPARNRADVRQFIHHAKLAGINCATERAMLLPGGEARRRGSRSPSRIAQAVRARSQDWAEPTAELGLAGNMAFVIGPRSLTLGLNLERRVFLHSYDASTDPTGAVIGGILTAPLIVAQWINAQYYFSTTDPEIFGSGTKAVHNVLGDVGVLSGPSGDLRRGLAWQSVRAGSKRLHEPIRLMALAQARHDHIDSAIASSITLRQLVENEWISLIARSHDAAEWHVRTRDGWSVCDFGLDATQNAQHSGA